MFWRRLITTWLCLAMVLLGTGTESAASSARAKPHQGYAELFAALSICANGVVGAGGHTGNLCLSGAVTSDVPHAARGATEASSVLLRTGSQLASKFKHAGDFGVVGNYSKANAAAFSRAIHRHINSPAVRAIEGTYHKAPATHYLDPSSGLNVMADSAGSPHARRKKGGSKDQAR